MRAIHGNVPVGQRTVPTSGIIAQTARSVNRFQLKTGGALSMRHTLYIDEAGPFEFGDSGQPRDLPWLVGGILVQGDYQTSEECLSVSLKRAFEELLNLDWFGRFADFVKDSFARPFGVPDYYSKYMNEVALSLEDPRWAHRVSYRRAFDYYFRSDGIDLFQHMSLLDEAIVSAAEAAALSPRKVAAIYSRKPLIPDRTNYALLVQDTLMTILGELGAPNREMEAVGIEVIIAQRGFDDHQKEIHRLDKHFISNAIACGMASMDMLSTFEEVDQPVRLTGVGQSFGMPIADFVCGNTRQLLDGLAASAWNDKFTAKQILYSFSTNTPAQRRSRIAEVRGDLGDAIVAQLTAESPNTAELSRLVKAMLSGLGQMEVRYCIESIIGRLDRWGRRAAKAKMVRVLKTLLATLDEAMGGLNVFPPAVAAASYRLRSYALIWANQIGDIKLSAALRVKLDEDCKRVASDPLIQESLFHTEVGAIEEAINEHRFAEAEAQAQRHLASVRSFADLRKDARIDALQHFEIRAQTLELKSSALAAVNQADHEKLELVGELAMQLASRIRKQDELEAGTANDDLIRVLQIEAYCAEVRCDVPLLIRIREELAVLLHATIWSCALSKDVSKHRTPRTECVRRSTVFRRNR
jgi:hypothetical protein